MLSLYKSDKSILEAIRNNDETALDYLYKSNIRMIIKIVVDNNGSQEDAQEILQDVLVLFWEKVYNGKFDLTSKISTYLYAVAKNKWLQELNRRKKHTTIEDIKNNPGHNKLALEQIEEEETIEIVKKCLDQLNPLCKKILILYYYQGMSMNEISKETGLANENVAKAKKYQCKKELEDMIKSISNQFT